MTTKKASLFNLASTTPTPKPRQETLAESEAQVFAIDRAAIDAGNFGLSWDIVAPWGACFAMHIGTFQTAEYALKYANEWDTVVFARSVCGTVAFYPSQDCGSES